MSLITLDPLAIVTFQRLSALRAFIDLLDASLPEVESRQRESLDRLATEQDWDPGEYSLERSLLDEHFGHWMPRLSAYSVITLLQSVVETRLFASAERVAPCVFSPRELLSSRGRTTEVAVLYLRKAGVDVTLDPAWARLTDLRELRDIIVHRGGTRGKSKPHQETFDRLIQRYEPELALAERADWWHGEVLVSLALCREFAEDVGRFFARILGAIGVKEGAIPRGYRGERGASQLGR